MMWLGAALLTATFWGLSYAAAEHALKSGLSTFTMLAVYCLFGLPIFGCVAWLDGTLKQGTALMKQTPSLIFWLAVVIVFYSLGNVLVLWAVKQKNATAVSFVEISYPVFVALFSFLIFHTNNLTLGTALGGALVFAGVSVMYLVG